MGKQGSTSGKRQREVDKAAKAKAKRERRQQLKTEEGRPDRSEAANLDSAAVLDRLAELHRKFEAAEIGFVEYDEAKAALLHQLHVE
jgi:hypothetical protein